MTTTTLTTAAAAKACNEAKWAFDNAVEMGRIAGGTLEALEAAQAAWAVFAAACYDAQFAQPQQPTLCGHCGTYNPEVGQSCGCFDNNCQ